MAHQRQGHSPPANATADGGGLQTALSPIPGFQDASRLNQRVKYEECARRMRRWRHRTHMTSSGTHIRPSMHTHACRFCTHACRPTYAKCRCAGDFLIICLPWRLAVQVLGGGPEHSPAPSAPSSRPAAAPSVPALQGRPIVAKAAQAHWRTW